jgi:hypothetical protein
LRMSRRNQHKRGQALRQATEQGKGHGFSAKKGLSSGLQKQFRRANAFA